MNYTSWSFWLLFAVVYVLYWRLGHRGQNRLLLIASYIFYGFWDYRFLFLILVSTVIDFIGGLGVAGIRLSAARLCHLGLLVVGSSVFLCAPIDYPALASALVQKDWGRAAAALPHTRDALSIPLGVAATTLAYLGALPWLYRLPRDTRRKTFLTISMMANLGILGFFKYCDFFIVSFERTLSTLGWIQTHIQVLGIILPAGISFYTFQAMSYTIDIYRGETEPTDNFPDFALFVCFFPHLVAGPIMRAHTLLPQVVQTRGMKPGAAREGLYLVLLGLFKKLVVADNLAPVANLVFNTFASGGSTPGAEVLVGLYAFAFQIYGDFSGYSSIARGISKWLGFELVVNFDSPYLAVSPSDFWRRWHISLSTWLRDYLYIPLGGNRLGTARTYRNLLLTMFLGGLWHGAAWTFMAWGLGQGLLLCLYRVIGVRDQEPSRALGSRVRWLISVVLMFHLTCLGWLLFRADSLPTAGRMLASLFTDWRPGGASALFALVLFFAGPLFVWESWSGREDSLCGWLERPWLGRACLLTYLLLMLLVFRAENPSEFIYFQF